MMFLVKSSIMRFIITSEEEFMMAFLMREKSMTITWISRPRNLKDGAKSSQILCMMIKFHSLTFWFQLKTQ